MGWKAEIIMASTEPNPDLANQRSHHRDGARQIVDALPGKFQYATESSFEEGVFPNPGDLFVGAYGSSLLIGSHQFAEQCFGQEPEIVSVIQQILPGAEVLALRLHSVVNFYGYALFQHGQRVRVRAGSGDDGVLLDEGEWLSEEHELFSHATQRGGEWFWTESFGDEVEEMDHSCMGEEFVFELSRRFLGVRIDEIDGDQIPMSRFDGMSQSLWRRLLSWW